MSGYNNKLTFFSQDTRDLIREGIRKLNNPIDVNFPEGGNGLLLDVLEIWNYYIS